MAYYDNNGKITIDENVAWQDVNKIQIAIDRLVSSKNAINNIINQANLESGLTSNAIIEKATELKKQIDESINKLNDTIGFIKKTVYYYQDVDRKVKEAIQAAKLSNNDK